LYKNDKPKFNPVTKDSLGSDTIITGNAFVSKIEKFIYYLKSKEYKTIAIGDRKMGNRAITK